LGNDENADFDVTVRNGNFSYGGHAVNLSKSLPGNSKGWTTQNYKGRLGKGNNDKIISINSNYGNVKFE
jgi:hypothetical protein